MKVNNQEWSCPKCGSPDGTPTYFMTFKKVVCGACKEMASWERWRATAIVSTASDAATESAGSTNEGAERG